MTPLAIMLEARRLIFRRRNWTQYAEKKDYGGHCAIGAIIEAEGDDEVSGDWLMGRLNLEAYRRYGMSLIRVNDDDGQDNAFRPLRPDRAQARAHRRIISLFNWMIAELRETAPSIETPEPPQEAVANGQADEQRAQSALV